MQTQNNVRFRAQLNGCLYSECLSGKMQHHGWIYNHLCVSRKPADCVWSTVVFLVRARDINRNVSSLANIYRNLHNSLSISVEGRQGNVFEDMVWPPRQKPLREKNKNKQHSESWKRDRKQNNGGEKQWTKEQRSCCGWHDTKKKSRTAT